MKKSMAKCLLTKGMHLNVLKDIAVSLAMNENAHFCYSYL